jgi:hypothetical protein
MSLYLPYADLSDSQRAEADLLASFGGEPAAAFRYEISGTNISSRVSIAANPRHWCARCGKDLAGGALCWLEHDKGVDAWCDGGVAPALSGGARPFDLDCADLLQGIASDRIAEAFEAELDDLDAQRPGFANIEIVYRPSSAGDQSDTDIG